MIGKVFFTVTAAVLFVPWQGTRALGDHDSAHRRILVCFRNDDISALSDADHERRVMAVFDQYKLRQTIGVIPNECEQGQHDLYGTSYRSLESNPAIVSLLREWLAEKKVEIALHGFTHQANRIVSIRERKEFAEFRGLTYEEQCSRIRQGRAICRLALGVEPTTFIPPWNEWDRHTLRACVDNGVGVISAELYTCPQEGLVAVNANADLESLPERIRMARERADGQVLIVALYHSRGIRSYTDFQELENAVAAAANARDVRVVTAGELAESVPAFLAKVNLAGRNLAAQVQVAETHDRGAATIYRRLGKAFGLALPVEKLYSRAVGAYHQGDYQQAASLSTVIDAECDSLVSLSRTALGLLGMGYGALALGGRWQMAAKSAKGAGLTMVVFLVPVVVGAALVCLATSSAVRKELFFGTSIVLSGSVAGAILATPVRTALSKRRRASQGQACCSDAKSSGAGRS